MALALLQLVLTVAACFALWRLWRRAAGRGPASVIIGAGFVVRAFIAQALFWISWLRLPIGRSLQIGNGFWFFAIDGPGLLAYANLLAPRGMLAILFPDETYPSHFFVQVFTLFVAAFGGIASVAILLNCAAYLLTCALVISMTVRDGRVSAAGLVALAALAFGPAAILWSLQPLKDTFFFLLIVAIVAVCRRWQGMWQGDVGAKARWQLPACALAILGLTYAIGGIRWYVAVMFWAAFAIFSILTVLSAHRRGWAVVTSALLVLLLAHAVRLGGGTNIPQSVGRVLNPKTLATWRPTAVVAEIGDARKGFEATKGATRILVVRPLETSRPQLTPSPPEPSPQTFFQRIISGFAAMFLPHRVAQAFGLIRVGGGRGLWLFVELDTLAFDLVLLYAIVYCAGTLIRSRGQVTPLFVLLLLVFVMLAGPMMYTVTNFGTLFRLRQMLYVIAAILPVTLAERESELLS
jgi:hypothetical protein